MGGLVVGPFVTVWVGVGVLPPGNGVGVEVPVGESEFVVDGETVPEGEGVVAGALAEKYQNAEADAIITINTIAIAVQTSCFRFIRHHLLSIGPAAAIIKQYQEEKGKFFPYL